MPILSILAALLFLSTMIALFAHAAHEARR